MLQHFENVFELCQFFLLNLCSLFWRTEQFMEKCSYCRVVDSPSCSMGVVAAIGASPVSFLGTSLPKPDSSPKILDKSRP